MIIPQFQEQEEGTVTTAAKEGELTAGVEVGAGLGSDLVAPGAIAGIRLAL